MATGGHSSVVTVWQLETRKDYARLEHKSLDPNLKGLEIDWQDNSRLAITGSST